VCESDYVRLLNLNGHVKTARRHSVVDMQFEFRIEALGNDFHINIFFAQLVIFVTYRFSHVAYSFFSFCSIFLLNVQFLLDIIQAVRRPVLEP